MSLLFSILFGVAALVIYTLFSDFRKDEFESRLKEKAMSSVKLLIEENEIDNQLLKVIDQNTINKLYDEKTLIFDADFNLIYSSLDDTKIRWTTEDLKYLKKNKTFFKKDGNYEVYGVYYVTNNKGSYALISASDNYGNRKLVYLVYLLIFTYLGFTTLCWFVTSFVVKKLLVPLDVFHNQIKNINENNLDTRIAVKAEKDEIDLLADEFNQMLHRIDESYQKQKEFTAHASHELRTPITRLTSQLENKIFSSIISEDTRIFCQKLLVDVNQISELISSLLLLSKLDNKANLSPYSYRIDEIIYDSIGKITKTYPEFRIALDIELSDDMDKIMEVVGNKSLLEIAFSNLLKNACIYADDKQAKVHISSDAGNLKVKIINRGEVLSLEEQTHLFQAFMRGNNAKGKSGLGLGLIIVHRIILQHNAEVSYQAILPNLNVFQIIFRH